MDEDLHGFSEEKGMNFYNIDSIKKENSKEGSSAEWKVAEEDSGHIQFMRKKNGKRTKVFLKGLAFIVIASVSGGAAGAVVTNQRLNNEYYDNNPSFRNQIKVLSTGSELPKTNISLVAEEIVPCVVGISTSPQGFSSSDSVGNGSGIIIDANGTILTNYHFIKDAEKVYIKLSNNKVFNAIIVGVDKPTDIAVIKIDSKDIKNLPVPKIGDATKMRVGDTAIAIGNMMGDELYSTVTQGIISSANREMVFTDQESKETATLNQVLQTDAAINKGNSGGPLCNGVGEVIGINSIRIGIEAGTDGVGYAESINDAMAIVSQLIDKGNVDRPDLGVLGKTLNSSDAIKNIKGVYIYEVKTEGGAKAAGVRPGDIITVVDNIKVEKLEELEDCLSKHKIGDMVICKIYRDAKTISVNIKLTKQKAS